MTARLELEPILHCVLSLPAEYGKTTTEIMGMLTQRQALYQEDTNITTLLTVARAPINMLGNGSGVCHYKRMLTNIILKKK